MFMKGIYVSAFLLLIIFLNITIAVCAAHAGCGDDADNCCPVHCSRHNPIIFSISISYMPLQEIRYIPFPETNPLTGEFISLVFHPPQLPA
ncbi:MAG: hypothetical protein A2Y62_04115 [Candidatus Fischerbacteria bacterium RBG_13_37_8]|uniref:Uncharacterized protein n=1 Tax=Candidatus Fischerbacteria bacterium RBG_13_37_8 TaxID=1817863 RepID=A0A1F5V5D8_9BACT|nr:MAG: hypothetical protein A2Y62_04115 [Candidatus Fischerbacteria bacterium RBG_13_37_8]